jgi:hypothetical protein
MKNIKQFLYITFIMLSNYQLSVGAEIKLPAPTAAISIFNETNSDYTFAINNATTMLQKNKKSLISIPLVQTTIAPATWHTQAILTDQTSQKQYGIQITITKDSSQNNIVFTVILYDQQKFQQEFEIITCLKEELKEGTTPLDPSVIDSYHIELNLRGASLKNSKFYYTVSYQE